LFKIYSNSDGQFSGGDFREVIEHEQFEGSNGCKVSYEKSKLDNKIYADVQILYKRNISNIDVDDSLFDTISENIGMEVNDLRYKIKEMIDNNRYGCRFDHKGIRVNISLSRRMQSPAMDASAKPDVATKRFPAKLGEKHKGSFDVIADRENKISNNAQNY
jgi:hypothetical protein